MTTWCDACNMEFEDETEEGYPMCIDCSCSNNDETFNACFRIDGHEGPCAFTLEGMNPPVTDEEVAQAVASIKKAAAHV